MAQVLASDGYQKPFKFSSPDPTILPKNEQLVGGCFLDSIRHQRFGYLYAGNFNEG